MQRQNTKSIGIWEVEEDTPGLRVQRCHSRGWMLLTVKSSLDLFVVPFLVCCWKNREEDEAKRRFRDLIGGRIVLLARKKTFTFPQCLLEVHVSFEEYQINIPNDFLPETDP